MPPCHFLEPRDFRVRIGWAPARVTAVECPEGYDLYAVIADLSGSVEGYQFRMAPGLRRLVETIGPARPFMLATLGDEFRCLRPPLAGTPEEAAEAWKVWNGWGSRNWEGLLSLLRFLETRPGRKLVVMAADGGAASAALFPACRELLDELPDVDLAVVYPAETRRSEVEIDGENRLGELVDRSGGFMIHGSRRFDDAVPRILGWELGRLTLSADVPAGAPREPVSVRLRPGLRWKVRRAREAGRRGRPCPVLVREGDERGDARRMLDALGLAAGSGPAAGRRVEVLLESGWLPGSGEWHPGWWIPEPGWFVFRGEALLSCGDHWYSWPDYWQRGNYHMDGQRQPVVAQRPIALRVLPVERVRREVRGPADALILLAREGVASGRERRLWPLEPSPVMLEGRSFLEWQRVIARILLSRGSGYRELVEQARREEVRRAVGRVVGDRPLAAAGSAARKTIEARVRERGERDCRWPDWRFVGGLLGDVYLREVGEEIDRRLAGAFLRREGERTGMERWLVDRGEELWNRLLAWIPPAAPVRGLVPLVPAWSEEQQRIGFWRILPAGWTGTMKGGLAPESLPEAPLGLRLVRRMMRRGWIPGGGARSWSVAKVRYRSRPAGGRHRAYPVSCTVELARRGQRLVVRGLFRREAKGEGRFDFGLKCIEIGGSPGVAGSVRTKVRRAGLRCAKPVDELVGVESAGEDHPER